MPDAVRRHSVYHHPVQSRPLSPPPEPVVEADEHVLLTQSPDSVYDDHDDEEWAEEPSILEPPSSHLQARDSWQSRFPRHSQDLANSDTVILALHSRMAAVRDREALGIPPSASDVGCVGDGGRERMSYMDSGSSLARVGMSWEGGGGKDAGDLSFGAEKLFRTLSGRTVEGGGDRDTWSGDNGYAFGQDDILKGRAMEQGRPTSLAFSQSSSASSVYEDENVQGPEDTRASWQSGEVLHEEEENVEEEENPLDEPAEDAWRHTVSPATYAAIADRYGPLEIHRQEAIHALCVTEELFVARLTNTIDLFILPLRMQNSKCYISGVPAEIAKLFDWLEDILNLHTQLLSALRHVQEAQHPVVERVTEAIRGSFVKRLEVYQPYLARLVNVAGTIARLVADTTSDFGEFVRIQEGVVECRGWNLEGLLVDPVTRLGRYPAIFRKLLECTPKSHTDYIPTFGLLHSTEMVIKVMTEVKIREDEYDLVKSISQRIKGLPSAVPLAKRGRRLLYQGQLIRIRTDILDPEPYPVDESVLLDDRRKSRAEPPKRSSNLVHAIQEWGQRRERSGSVKSNGSSSTAASFSSYATNSSGASSEPPLTPSSPRFPSRSSFQMARSKVSGSARTSTPQEGTSPYRSSLADARSGETQLVQVFIFTDFVVVTSVSKSRHYESEEWTLLENVGIAKVLGVTELPSQNNSAVLSF
ncbi:Dbl homology domain-containing protein [Mycena vulgaris]|nr:Dbl homology domain-containing protein [Mycena vulgaris]